MNGSFVKPETGVSIVSPTASVESAIQHDTTSLQISSPGKQARYPAHRRGLPNKTEWMITSPSEAHEIMSKCLRDCPEFSNDRLFHQHLTQEHGLHIFADGMFFKRVTVLDFDRFGHDFCRLWSVMVLLRSYRPGRNNAVVDVLLGSNLIMYPRGTVTSCIQVTGKCIYFYLPNLAFLLAILKSLK